MGTGTTDLYTLDDIAQEVCDAYGDNSPVSLQKAYRAVNRALRTINAKGTWLFSSFENIQLNTVAGQEQYTVIGVDKLPRILHMISPMRKIRRIDTRMLRQIVPNNTQTQGVPLTYRLVGYDKARKANIISFWPIPDGVYNIFIDGDANIPLLNDADDDIRTVSGMPEEMIEVVISTAIAHMLRKIDDELYQSALAESNAMIEEAYFRMAADPDNENKARQYDVTYDSHVGDPTLPPQYS